MDDKFIFKRLKSSPSCEKRWRKSFCNEKIIIATKFNSVQNELKVPSRFPEFLLALFLLTNSDFQTNAVKMDPINEQLDVF